VLARPRRLRRARGRRDPRMRRPRRPRGALQRRCRGSVRPGVRGAALPDGVRVDDRPRGLFFAGRPCGPLISLFHRSCRTTKTRGFGANRNPQRNAAVLCGFRLGTIPRVFGGETLESTFHPSPSVPMFGTDARPEVLTRRLQPLGALALDGSEGFPDVNRPNAAAGRPKGVPIRPVKLRAPLFPA